MIESATFWKDSPEIATGEILPEACRTEVFFFPAAAHTEKEGTFTQTQRLLQWREKAVEPKGDQRSDLWFFYHLGSRVKEKLAEGTDERDRPIRDLVWDYALEGDEPQARRAQEHQWLQPRHRRAARRIPGSESRRQHLVRLLDLQRCLRRRSQPGGPARTGRRTGLRPRVGMGVAIRPEDSVQPGLCRPGGPALERSQGGRVVGRGRRRVDR